MILQIQEVSYAGRDILIKSIVGRSSWIKLRKKQFENYENISLRMVVTDWAQLRELQRICGVFDEQIMDINPASAIVTRTLTNRFPDGVEIPDGIAHDFMGGNPLITDFDIIIKYEDVYLQF